MEFWLLHCNPRLYRISAYLRDHSEFVYWNTSKGNQENQITIHDVVFVFRSLGDKTEEGGIIAVGRVEEGGTPKGQVKRRDFRDFGDRYWKEPAHKLDDSAQVGIGLFEVRLGPEMGMLKRDNLLKMDPGLECQKVIRNPRWKTWVRLGENDGKRLCYFWDHPENGFAGGDTAREPLFEGRFRAVSLGSYERNPFARARCIAEHGCRCVVCEIDFEREYGEWGRGFIHVHHVKPLSENRGEREVDPVTDLRPLCPNCHAMVHRDRKKPCSLEDLKKRRREACERRSGGGIQRT